MTSRQEILNLYKGLSWKEALYIKLRGIVNPIDAVERYLPKKGRIYDIGCGVGLLANIAAIRSADRQVIGIDLSEEKIEIANKSVSLRPNIAFKAADALKLELVNPAAVTLCDALHHIPTEGQERLLKYLYGTLQSGGVLIIQDIDKRPVHKYLFARGVDMLLNMNAPVYYRDRDVWAQVLRDIGFTVEVDRIDKGYPIAAVLFRCTKG